MAGEDDQPREGRGRGRPRMPEQDKKRHSMTFRMRTDLRAAVEELAAANGRSMSEQIEHYVERGAQADVGDVYTYDSRSLSPVLLRWFYTFAKRFKSLGGNGEQNEPLSSEPAKEYFAFNPNLGSEINRMFNGLAHDAILSHLGDNLTPEEATNIERSRQALDAKITERERLEKPVEAANEEQKLIAELERELALRRTEREWALQLELASARTEIEALKRADNQLTSESNSQAPESDGLQYKTRFQDCTIDGLQKLLGQFDPNEAGLDTLRASGWPQKFISLPATTRGVLIGMLRGSALETYEAVMSPEGPHRQALAAFRRLRGALLGPSDKDEGPFEDPLDSGE